MTQQFSSIYGLGARSINTFTDQASHTSLSLYWELIAFYCKSCLLLHSILTLKITTASFTEAPWSKQWAINRCFWLIISIVVITVFNTSHSNNQSIQVILILFPDIFTSLKANLRLCFCGHLLQSSGRSQELPGKPKGFPTSMFLGLTALCLLSYLTPFMYPKAFFRLSLLLISPFPVHTHTYACNGCLAKQSSNLNKIYKICIWQFLLTFFCCCLYYIKHKANFKCLPFPCIFKKNNFGR